MTALKKVRSKIPLLSAFLVALGVAVAAYANTTNGPTNTLPKADIPQDNGQINAKGLSNDPQILQFVFDATGAAAATTSFTTFADATHFPGQSKRGAGIADSTTGFAQITRSGLYEVDVACNGTGTTGDTITIDAEISLDGGTTWTQISGTQASSKVLTGILQVNLAAQGLVSISSANAGAAAGQTVIAMRGKDSANTLTCAGGGGMLVKRVDTLQPYAYP